ncbi:MAG: AraC family transcriptional regulator [Aureispira sp.]|jgi:AraC family transcriptional regulator
MLNHSPYFHRLIPVLDYIQANYNQSITPKKLEQISFYSYRSLQRIFKSLFGETIGVYQKRIRLENAAKLMHYSDKSITDIAIEVGYADLQAFRKAFKRKYHIAPSSKRPELLQLLEQLQQKIKYPTFAIEALEATKVALPSIEVVFKTYQGPYDNVQLDLVWEQLFEACSDLEKPEEYGLVFDDIDITHPQNCRYDACLSFPKSWKNANIPTKKIGNKNYMRFLHKGNYNQIDATYDVIFGGWLLENNCNFSTDSIIEHYYYNQNHTEDEAAFLTHIYIPI